MYREDSLYIVRLPLLKRRSLKHPLKTIPRAQAGLRYITGTSNQCLPAVSGVFRGCFSGALSFMKR